MERDRGWRCCITSIIRAGSPATTFSGTVFDTGSIKLLHKAINLMRLTTGAHFRKYCTLEVAIPLASGRLMSKLQCAFKSQAPNTHLGCALQYQLHSGD